MTQHTIGIIMNGVTGRMGTNQHLVRSILAIREEGGLKCANGDTIMPEPVLMGRNEKKLQALAEKYGIKQWTTHLDTCLADDNNPVYFDAQVTSRRVESVLKAIKAGKSVYCEKPVAENLEQGLLLYREAELAGVKTGVVQDKLWLPGLKKLKQLVDSGFFGKILSVKADFGYWVHDGKDTPAQRPSWNYRKEDGGGITVDMLCHWRYVIDNLFGNIRSLSSISVIHVDKRWDEEGKPYDCTADDGVYTTIRLDNGIVCHLNSSWTTRVRKDDLLTIQVDGTQGSAVAGLIRCMIQTRSNTPTYLWNPDLENGHDYLNQGWLEYEPNGEYVNAFKAQWELFLRHAVCDEPFTWNLLEGAKGIQMAERALESNEKRAWVDVEALST